MLVRDGLWRDAGDSHSPEEKVPLNFLINEDVPSALRIVVVLRKLMEDLVSVEST